MNQTTTTIYQKSRSRELTPEELQVGLTSNLFPVEHYTIITTWMGYRIWTVTFKRTKEGALHLMFKADTLYFQPYETPEALVTWLTDTLKGLPIGSILTPIGKPRKIDILYWLTCSLDFISVVGVG